MPTGRQLLTIKTDCDLNGYVEGLPALDSIAINAPDTGTLKGFYEKYGFKGLARALEGKAAPAEPSDNAKPPAAARTSEPGLFDELSEAAPARASTVVYDTLLTWDAFDAWLAKVEAADLVAVDTETTSLDEMRAEIVGISFSVTPGEAPTFRSSTPGPTRRRNCRWTRCWPSSSPGWKTARKKKLGQHIKYDRHVFANHGIEVQGYAHDTMLQSYVLEVHKPHGLSSLAERHLGRSGITYEDLCGKGAHQIPFAQVDVAKAAEYSCEDSDQTLGRSPHPVAAAGERRQAALHL